MGRRWTQIDIDFIKNNPDLSARELGHHLNRTESSITNRRTDLNLCKTICLDNSVAYNVFRGTYIKNAEKRNLIFDISMEAFKQIVSEPCVYCGDGFRKYNPYLRRDGSALKRGDLHRIEHAWATVTGLDRIDSSKGYTLDNVESCCEVCNWLKNNLSKQEFLDHIEKINNHQQKKKDVNI